MTRIGEVVALSHGGEAATARERLLGLWNEIGVTGDPFHRCSVAHYLADLYDDPAQALVWDVRALDAADAVTEERVQQHHAGLHIAGFYPSLHLNLADNFRRLSSFSAAADHITAARQHLDQLADDDYGRLIRRAVEEVTVAIQNRSTTKRPPPRS